MYRSPRMNFLTESRCLRVGTTIGVTMYSSPRAETSLTALVFAPLSATPSIPACIPHTNLRVAFSARKGLTSRHGQIIKGTWRSPTVAARQSASPNHHPPSLLNETRGLLELPDVLEDTFSELVCSRPLAMSSAVGTDVLVLRVVRVQVVEGGPVQLRQLLRRRTRQNPKCLCQ